MKENQQYDYIISGAGCAGLSLAMRMLHSGRFRNKRILLVDAAPKNQNDRTWCFWEKGDDLFQPVVYKEWDRLFFHSDTLSKELRIRPYKYKLIRGIDFYKRCLETINEHPNVTFLQNKVEKIFGTQNEAHLVAGGKTFTAPYLFNSILFYKPELKKNHYWLLQHFKGWFIKTARPAFDASAATLMDFRTDQSAGATFFYVLPFSSTEALVEYTLFSGELLPDSAYEEALQGYVKDVLGISNYEVTEKEFGVIPMTNYPFPQRENNIVHIGTAGGWTKGSSGYTFRFIQKNTADLVQSLLRYGHPFGVKTISRRFRFYDSVLLHILQHRTLKGAGIFTDLFNRNEPRQVLKFLDNETSLREELNIIRSLPTWPFAKAALRQWG